HVLFFHEAEDVFEHDDGVVDHDTDHKSQREHGDLIQREAHGGHQREGRDDRRRNGDGGNQSGAPVGEKDEDDDRGEDAAFDEVLADGTDCGLNESRLVADDLGRDVFRQPGAHHLETVFDVIGRGDSVLSGLLGDDQCHGGHAIEARGRHRLFVTVFAVADVADLDDIAVAVRDGDLIELRGIRHAAGRADREILRALFEAAAGKFEVLRFERVENVGDREAVRAQLIGIDQHVDLALRAAHDADLTDTFRVLQFLLNQLVGDHREIAQRAGRGDGDLHDRRGVRIHLLNNGLLRGGRQIVGNQVDLVLDFLRGDVAVLRKFEGDDDERLAFGRSGAQFVDLTDGVDGVFYLLGDFGFHFFGRSAGIGDDDLHGWDVDFGEEVDAEAEIRECADDDERENQHRREDGPADTELG